MRRILSILLENESGALSRVSGLFSARGYNIESLTVAPTEDNTLSRMTIVTSGSEKVIEQITKQLNKLVDDVIQVNQRTGMKFTKKLMDILGIIDMVDLTSEYQLRSLLHQRLNQQELNQQ